MKRRHHPIERGYVPYELITSLDLDDQVRRERDIWRKRAAILAVLLCAAVATLIAVIVTHSPAPEMCPACGTAAPVVQSAQPETSSNHVIAGAGE